MFTLRRVTYDDFLTLTLAERIAWLHSQNGPKGFLSHDDFAEQLGTSRQVIIGWEKEGGSEPKRFVGQLAAFSGFPEEAFLRRTAEVPVREMYGRRLARLEASLERILRALDSAGIAIPAAPEEPQSEPSGPRPRRRKTGTGGP